ncbi:MAG TPA: Tex-like N-terminal domain-containing protein [Caldisericia bacterium]|nr:Tex-like N-terminal domain-containing protein [Caldisericia bacterium]
MNQESTHVEQQDIHYISQQMGIAHTRIEAALTLREQGCSLAFIARYRKETTKNLSDEELRDIFQWADIRIELKERKQSVLNILQKKERLYPLLEERLKNAQTIEELEAIYQPYKQPRITAAEKARKAGLEKLKEQIVKARTTVSLPLSSYISAEYQDEKAVWEGICSLIEEDFVLQPVYHQELYRIQKRYSSIVTEAKQDKDPGQTYKRYHHFTCPLMNCKPYQLLAIFRGEKEKALKVQFSQPNQWVERILDRYPIVSTHHPYRKEIVEIGKNALQKRILPSVTRQLRTELLKYAQNRSLVVFGKNLRSLLLQKPLGSQPIVGIDPGFKMGSKWALIDEKGDLRDIGLMFPAPPQKEIRQTFQILDRCMETMPFTFIVIGNGTASFEVSQVIAQWIQKRNGHVGFRRVSETGASIYSASDKARKEFPHIDVLYRGAISIARRAQNPLSEFLKIPPESLGVGMYQHDIPAGQLKEYLAGEVSMAVNKVGINLNTASVELLQHISGISTSIAEKIIQHRNEKGIFKNRSELLLIRGIGEKTFQQCAGFCRIPDGECILDNTMVHPESYDFAKKILAYVQVSLKDYAQKSTWVEEKLQSFPTTSFCSENDATKESVEQILAFLLLRDGDFRDTLEEPPHQATCLSLEELHTGMQISGCSTNITDFGIFFDIGCESSGFMPLKIPLEKAFRLYPIGQSVELTIAEIDQERKRIIVASN